MVEEYRSSDKAPVPGVLLLALASIVGGSAIGLVVFAVSNFLYLLILFPIAIAVVGIVATTAAVVKGKVRNPLIATLFGLVMGLSIYGAFHIANYYRFSSLLFQALSTSIPPADLPNVDRMATVSSLLERLTGSGGFLGYLKLTAREGISITSLYASEGSGIVMSGIPVYLYWLVEAVIIIGSTTFAGRAASLAPFCEKCNTRYGVAKHYGSVPAHQEASFLHLLRQGHLQEASALVANEDSTPPPNLEVYVRACRCATSPQVLLDLKKTTRGRENRVHRRELVKFLIPEQETPLFDRRTEAAQ
jgi:hypothetical protein